MAHLMSMLRSLDVKKHLAVTPMDKSQVDICRSCLGEVLFETCFRHECNWNTVHVTLINNRSKLALLGPYQYHLVCYLYNLLFVNLSSV